MLGKDHAEVKKKLCVCCVMLCVGRHNKILTEIIVSMWPG